jgi:endonuclease G, mitochondrial
MGSRHTVSMSRGKLVKRRKSGRSRSGTRRRLRFKGLFVFALILAAVGGGGWLWYQTQDEPTQRKTEAVVLQALEFGREHPNTPAELRFWLDVIADRLPLNIGQTVKVEDLSGDRTYLIGGVPESTESLRLLVNIGYISAYNEYRRNPDWVAYRVFANNLTAAPERPDSFNVDPRTRTRVSPEDYTNSGFDRGHMAPNHAIALLFGEDAQAETFLMSNIIPQSPDLNRRVWRDLEARIIRRYARRFEEVWVITGPVYQSRPPQRLPSGVKIPDACFKIIVDEHPQGLRVLAFVIPQDVRGDEDPGQFLTSVREIERMTGLNFFPELPQEAQDTLETWVPQIVW